MIRIAFLVILVSSCIHFSQSFTNPGAKENDVLFGKKALIVNQFGKSKIPAKNEEPSAIQPPLLIGSFNIQTLTRKKFNKPHIMDVIERIILRYDLMLIMEIHTEEDSYILRLLRDINRFLPPEESYNVTLSERQDSTKEHYALFYRKNKLKVITTESYDDPAIFYRKPLVVTLEALTLRDMKKFGVIAQHVRPSQAVEEISGLAEVYDYVKNTYEIEDVLLMGDFNADCSYVKENDWDKIDLWNRLEFTWAITNKMDTTTNYRSCTLDRFVYAGEKMNDGVILSTAGVFDFQEAFGLSISETRNVSDHWPIELKIRGKMSDQAEKHLTSNLCFQLRDSRERTNAPNVDIYNQARKASFDVTKTAVGILLSNKTRDEEQMLSALDRLRIALPNIVSKELVEAVKYKVNHGSLRDDSSFADVPFLRYIVTLLTTDGFSEMFICKTTTIN